MPKETFPMTKEGLEKLKQELVELESIKRDNAKIRINKARSFCDFQEDSEYEMALVDLTRIEDRISNLTYMLQHVDIIEKTETSVVGLGSTVSFKEISSGEQETYSIVGSEEADPLDGKISNESQVAQSLLGAKINAVVTIKAPGGNRQVKVVRIS